MVSGPRTDVHRVRDGPDVIKGSLLYELRCNPTMQSFASRDTLLSIVSHMRNAVVPRIIPPAITRMKL